MYKQILIAVDLAGEVREVLKKGRQLAGQMEAKYHVVYCINHPVTPFGELSVPGPMLNLVQLKHEIMAHFRKVAEEFGVDTHSISIEIGHPVDAILLRAEQDKSDLIIVGSHGMHGIRVLMGSTATGVLHHAKCDVLAIRMSD